MLKEHRSFTSSPQKFNKENSQEEVFFGLFVPRAWGWSSIRWLRGGVPHRIPDLLCWTDSACLSVQGFCCPLLIQSRAQGVIYCVLFKLSLQYSKSFSFVSFVSLSDIFSPLIVAPYFSLILMDSRCLADSSHRLGDYWYIESFPHPFLNYGSYKSVHVTLL